MELMPVVIAVGHLTGLVLTIRYLQSRKYPPLAIGVFILGVGLVTLVNIGAAIMSVGVVLMGTSLREIYQNARTRQALKRSE